MTSYDKEFEDNIDRQRKEREEKEAAAQAEQETDLMLPLRRKVNMSHVDIILTAGFQISKILNDAFEVDGDSNEETFNKVVAAGWYIGAMAHHAKELLDTFSTHQVPMEPSADERSKLTAEVWALTDGIGRKVRISTDTGDTAYGTITNVVGNLSIMQPMYLVTMEITGIQVPVTPEHIVFVD